MAVFTVAAAAALWVAWRGADQLLQALRIIPRLTDVAAAVWLLLAVTLASVVLSLTSILMAWRALQADRTPAMLLWLAAGALLSPALVEGAGALANGLG